MDDGEINTAEACSVYLVPSLVILTVHVDTCPSSPLPLTHRPEIRFPISTSPQPVNHPVGTSHHAHSNISDDTDSYPTSILDSSLLPFKKEAWSIDKAQPATASNNDASGHPHLQHLPFDSGGAQNASPSILTSAQVTEGRRVNDLRYAKRTYRVRRVGNHTQGSSGSTASSREDAS